jgi:His/Glu/Gln/Arg/opine family amino acid ABC transporter permease subunit
LLVRVCILSLWAGLSLLCARPAVGAAPEADASSDSSTPFRVALTGRYPPFSFYNAQGELDGFDVAVSRAVAARLGRPLELVATEWDGILPGLLAGRYDAIIGSMAVTPQREEVVNFSEPYYHSGAQLFIHRDRRDEIKGLAEEPGLRIGVVVGETYEQYLREHHADRVQVATYDDTQLIFQDLAFGRLDGFLSDRLVGAWQIRSAGAPFLPAGDMLYRERIAIPVARERAELLREINAALAELRASGELERLFDRWFGLDEETADVASEATMTFSLALRFLLKGFVLTLLIAALALTLGFAAAVPVGIVLNLSGGVARFVTRGVVDFIRGTPVLIQLFFVYYGWRMIPVIGMSLSPIAASVLTLSVNSAAYMAEVVRSGLMSVDPGQKLAGRAIGLSPVQVFRLIVWPQAFRIAMPSLMNSVVALIKDTALISVVTVSELISNVRSVVSVTYNPAYYLLAAALFFLVTFPLMKLAGQLEARMRAKGFDHD